MMADVDSAELTRLADAFDAALAALTAAQIAKVPTKQRVPLVQAMVNADAAYQAERARYMAALEGNPDSEPLKDGLAAMAAHIGYEAEVVEAAADELTGPVAIEAHQQAEAMDTAAEAVQDAAEAAQE